MRLNGIITAANNHEYQENRQMEKNTPKPQVSFTAVLHKKKVERLKSEIDRNARKIEESKNKAFFYAN